MVGWHPVEVGEPSPPRSARPGLDQGQPAGQRSLRKVREPVAVRAAAHEVPAYLGDHPHLDVGDDQHLDGGVEQHLDSGHRRLGTDDPRRRRIVIAAVAVITLGLAAIVAVAQSSPTAAVLRALMVFAVVPCAAIDLDRRIIPNRITGAGALVAVVAGLALDSGGELSRLLWAAAAGGFLLLAALVRPSGMGMGDVKLTAMMGLFLGRSVVIALLAALLASAITGLLIAGRRGVRAARTTAIPFGPYLAAGGILAALVGDTIVRAYLAMHS